MPPARPPLLITLPAPPSANRMHRLAGGRPRRSTEYSRWLETAKGYIWSAVLNDGTPPAGPIFAGPVAVDITVPQNRRRDLDNHAKPILDSLQAAGVLANDRQVVRLAMAFGPAAELAGVLITPAAETGHDSAGDSESGKGAKTARKSPRRHRAPQKKFPPLRKDTLKPLIP